MTLSELTEGLAADKTGNELLAMFHRAYSLDDRGRKILLEVMRGTFKGMAGEDS